MTLLGFFDFIFLSELKSEIFLRIQYIRFLKEQWEVVDHVTYYLCALNINLMGHQVPFTTLATNLNCVPWSYCCCGHKHKKNLGILIFGIRVVISNLYSFKIWSRVLYFIWKAIWWFPWFGLFGYLSVSDF